VEAFHGMTTRCLSLSLDRRKHCLCMHGMIVAKQQGGGEDTVTHEERML
jgi:hypothetical protein